MRRTPLAMIFCSALLMASPAIAHDAEGAQLLPGYIVGAYSYGNNVGDTGKFTLTLKRAGNGPWLIFSDMDNSNAPPRAR